MRKETGSYRTYFPSKTVTLVQDMYTVIILSMDFTINYLKNIMANGISGSLIWSKTLMELVFNPCGKFRCEVRRAQLAKSTLLTSSLVPLGSFEIF